MKYSLLLVALLIPSTIFAHAGKLNAEGCHNNSKTGQYECHSVKVKEAKQVAKNTVKKAAKTASKTKAGDYNCVDFSSQSEAQKMFLKNGGPAIDPFDLDRDHDGKACEDLK